MKNITRLPDDSELIYEAFQKALANKRWSDRVDNTHAQLEGDIYSMRLTF
jgi:hypothetical protein